MTFPTGDKDVDSHRWQIRKICCIGAGYVGAPHGAVIANQNPTLSVTVVDLNAARINAWNSNNLPIYEADLDGLVKRPRDGDGKSRKPNLFFTTETDRAIAEADMIFLAINTPTKSTGLGMGRALDLGFVESAVRKIADVSYSNKIIVEKSTVPCRTAETIRDVLAANAKPGVAFEVLSNPEFLAEGTAVSDLMRPDRILIGSTFSVDGLRAAKALVDIYSTWVPRERIFTTNLWSSELAKLAANALLAQRISSVNSLSAICEATGANIDEVSYAVGLDKRIGPKMLKSSVGFGGSCFKKDVYCLVYLAESLNLPEVATYWKSVIDINEWQKNRFTRRIISRLYNTLYNKKIAIFGFAYKKNTGDTRESAAITIIQRLLAEDAKISIYDPQVTSQQIRRELNLDLDEAASNRVVVADDVYQACDGAHAVVIVTEWDEFGTDGLVTADSERRIEPNSIQHWPTQATEDDKGVGPPQAITLPHRKLNGTAQTGRENFVDWKRIASLMLRPSFIFDGRNIVNRELLTELGFRVESIGNAPLAFPR